MYLPHTELNQWPVVQIGGVKSPIKFRLAPVFGIYRYLGTKKILLNVVLQDRCKSQKFRSQKSLHVYVHMLQIKQRKRWDNSRKDRQFTAVVCGEKINLCDEAAAGHIMPYRSG